MTLRQTLQAAPSKAGEVLAKLRDTSNHAVKTRETLLAQLEAELQLYIELEEQHLLPVLKAHPETRPFVAGATKDNRELRARLSELASAPKDQDVFQEKLGVLAETFQRHIRDERKDLLPAISKALSDDEASTLATAIEDGAAQAEAARRNEARTEARREQEQAEQAEADQRNGRRAQRAVERNADEALGRAADTLQRTTDIAQDGVRRVSEAVADQSRQVAADAGAALVGYREAAQRAADDLRTVAGVSSITSSAISEIGSAWFDWVTKATQTSAQATQRLFQCRTPGQLADVQRQFATEMMQTWLEGSRRMLQLTEHSARKALRPLNERLGK